MTSSNSTEIDFILEIEVSMRDHEIFVQEKWKNVMKVQDSTSDVIHLSNT